MLLLVCVLSLLPLAFGQTYAPTTAPLTDQDAALNALKFEVDFDVTAIANEASRAKYAEVQIQYALDVEVCFGVLFSTPITLDSSWFIHHSQVNRAYNAESYISSVLSSEVARSIAALQYLNQNLNSEVSRAKYAENSLSACTAHL